MLLDETYWIKKKGKDFLQEKYCDITFNILKPDDGLESVPFQSIYNDKMTRYHELPLEEYVVRYVQQYYLFMGNKYSELAKAYLVEDFVRIFLLRYFSEMLNERLFEYIIEPRSDLQFNISNKFTFRKINRYFYGQKMNGDIIIMQFEFDYVCRIKPLESKEILFIAEIKTLPNIYNNGKKKLFKFLSSMANYVDVYYYLFRPPKKGKCIIPRSMSNNVDISENLHLSVNSIRFKKEDNYISIESLFKYITQLVKKSLQKYEIKTRKSNKLVLPAELLTKVKYY